MKFKQYINEENEKIIKQIEDWLKLKKENCRYIDMQCKENSVV